MRPPIPRTPASDARLRAMWRSLCDALDRDDFDTYGDLRYLLSLALDDDERARFDAIADAERPPNPRHRPPAGLAVAAVLALALGGGCAATTKATVRAEAAHLEGRATASVSAQLECSWTVSTPRPGS